MNENEGNCIVLFLCVCIPLGDSLAGGPSINVGGDRKGLVSDADRPRGDGPYGDLSAGGQGQFSECKVKQNLWPTALPG